MRKPVLAVMALVLAALALIAGASSPAIACSALPVPPTEQQFVSRADVIFEGVYVSSRDPNAGASIVSSADPIFFTFAADRVLKGGPISSPVVVSSARDGASCGATFTVGVRYRVYARNVSGALVTDSVSGNRPVSLESSTTTTPPATRPSAPAVPRAGTPRFTG